MASLAEAFELITDFQRSANYPRDEGGVQSLARGLVRAAESIGVSMREIVRRCAEDSDRCPTDAEMLSVARGIRGPEQMGGMAAHRTVCPICDGSGWQTIWMLWTHEGHGEHSYVRKERVTEVQANDLFTKIDKQKQMIYSGAKRCSCPVPEDRRLRAAGGDQ